MFENVPLLRAAKSSARSLCRKAVHSFLLLAAGLLVATALPAQQADEAGWLQFAPGQHRPAFEVTINGEDTIALLDTALSVNAISTEFAQRAGIGAGVRTLTLPDVEEGEEVSVAKPFDLELAGSSIEMKQVAMISTDEVGIVIGRPLLNLLVVQVDYPGRRLRLLPRGGVEFESNLESRRGRFNQPMVQATIDDRKVWLTLDTSNDGLCLLNRGTVEKNGWHREPVALKNVGALDIRTDVQTVRPGSLELAGYQIDGFVAAYLPDDAAIEDEGYGASRITQKLGGHGILGYEVLRNFVLTMNMAEDDLHVYVP